MKTSMTIEGGEDLARALRALPDGLTRKVVITALKEAGDPIAAGMAAAAPRSGSRAEAHTGYDVGTHLADSMRVQPLTPSRVSRSGRDPDTDFAVEIGPTRAHFYGFFQEHGTARLAAQPFARPAFDTGAPGALGTIGRQLWEAIKRQVPSGGAK